MGKTTYLAVLIFTFSSGFSGIGYRQFAERNCWPIGSEWGTRKLDNLALMAMVISALAAWITSGLSSLALVVIMGALLAFFVAAAIKHLVQLINLVGITLGSIVSVVGAFMLR